MKDILKFSRYTASLGTPVSSLKGIGEKRAKLLEKMGIDMLGDALFHFPRRYEDRRTILGISQVSPGDVQVVQGTIAEVSAVRARNTHIIKARLSEDSHSLTAIWFNQRHVMKRLKPGKDIVVIGRVKMNFGKLELYVQEFEEAGCGWLSGRIVAVYPSTAGLPQRSIREIISNGIREAGSIPERLPEYLRGKYFLPGIAESLYGIHFPADFSQLHKSQKRMIFEELFLHQFCLSRFSRASREEKPGIAHLGLNRLKEDFLDSLEFQLTEDQQKVISEIERDMEQPLSMRRLLQGDVGSGKTLVAIIAMLKAAANGFQSAFMVPTEVLAEQHFFYLRTRLQGLEVRAELLTGTVTGENRKKILADLAAGSIDILIGTQTLIQANVQFKNLGLVIIDEQHRFGVMQRTRLTDITPSPDMLVMTATPIPRSLELTFYADLDLSVIRQMPPGRKKIVTRYVAEREREKLYKFMQDIIASGQQAYVVCPLIEESEALEIAAAEKLAGQLERVFPGFSVGLLHGKLKSGQREEVMGNFKIGKIDILVSTTVIEVGIDVPNASIIVIEGAERFGLAQLHQLRGRVGRGIHQSYCFVLGKLVTPESKARISAIVKYSSGFDIADKDLEIRGPGDLFGTKQHGLPGFSIADPVRDIHWVEKIHLEVRSIERGEIPCRPEELQLLDANCRDIFSQFAAN